MQDPPGRSMESSRPCNSAQTWQDVPRFLLFCSLLSTLSARNKYNHLSGPLQHRRDPPPPHLKNFQKLLTCRQEGGASLPFSWTSGVGAASLPSCWDNRKNLQLHLKPLIRYHKHLYTYNVAGEQQADGSGETVTHFPHDPSEKSHADENGSY